MDGADGVLVRAAAPEEWAQARDLRLEMLADSPRSFVTQLREVSAWTDSRWQSRMQSMLAPDSVLIAAVDGDHWVGQASGRLIGARPFVLAVYLSLPTVVRGWRHAWSRPSGWVAGLGNREVWLDVHESAEAAQRSYQKQGYRFTGERSEHPHFPGTYDLEMVKSW